MTTPMRHSEVALIFGALFLFGCYQAHVESERETPRDGAVGPVVPTDASVDPDGGQSPSSDAGSPHEPFCDRRIETIDSTSLYSEKGRTVLMVVEGPALRRIYELGDAGFVPVEVAPSDVGTEGLTSALGAPLFEFGVEPTCGIRIIESDSSICSGALAPVALYAVRSDLAFAVRGSRLYRYDGSIWTQHTAVLPAGIQYKGVWADDAVVLAPSPSGLVEVATTPGSTPAFDGSAPRDGASVWSSNGSDAWVGGENTLHHRQVGRWETAWTSPCATDTGVHLAEVDGTLVFYTDHAVGRIESNRPVELVRRDCADEHSFSSVDGETLDQLIVVSVNRTAKTPCGRVSIARLDRGQLLPF